MRDTQADRVREFLQGIRSMSWVDAGWQLNKLSIGVVDIAKVTHQYGAEKVIPRLLNPSIGEADVIVVWAELSRYVDLTLWLAKIDWLILSGHPTEPTDLDGLRRVIADCREAGVKVWVRSLGARPFDAPNHAFDRTNEAWSVLPSEWPAWANVREVPACLEGE